MIKSETTVFGRVVKKYEMPLDSIKDISHSGFAVNKVVAVIQPAEPPPNIITFISLCVSI